MSLRALAVLLLAAVQAAGAQTDSACAEAVQQLARAEDGAAPGVVVIPRPGTEVGCADLYGVLSTRLSRLRGLAAGRYALPIAPRDVQPSQAATGGTAGSAAQSEAVPDARPAALAGGALSAVGTGEGTGAIASISVNPAALAVGDDPETVARLSRLLDVSILVPADGSDRDDDGRVDYLGARVRVNALGPAQGAAVYRDLVSAFETLLASEADELVRIRDLFESAPDTVACALALVDPEASGGRVERACGRPFAAVPAALYEAFQREADHVRHEADRAYIGLDLRLDVGDPTLSGVAGAWGWGIGAALALGRTFGEGPGSPELRVRAGAVVIDREAYTDGTRVAFDGAIGVAVDRPYGFQRLAGSLGVEWRYGTTPADGSPGDLVSALDQDVIRIRGALNVPLGPVYSASLSLAVPVVGEAGGPVLSVGGNWQMLWPGAD